MARKAHTAANTHSSTPISASLRDVYEFYLNDVTTKAVHVPHRWSTNPDAWTGLKSEIGPSLDPYFTYSIGSCRQNNIVIVTAAGRPTTSTSAPATGPTSW